MNTTKFKLTNEGIEICGSEEFVSSQLIAFQELIEKSFETILGNEKKNSTLEPNLQSDKKVLLSFSSKDNVHVTSEEADYTEVKNKLSDYENVFAIQGDIIRIVADIPGNSQAKRMINVILLYLWARLEQGIEVATFQEIREFCKLQGEFDSTNFSKHMDAHKKFFLIMGDSKIRSVRLIRPGIKEAEKLLNELNSSSN